MGLLMGPQPRVSPVPGRGEAQGGSSAGGKELPADLMAHGGGRLGVIRVMSLFLLLPRGED